MVKIIDEITGEIIEVADDKRAEEIVEQRCDIHEQDYWYRKMQHHEAVETQVERKGCFIYIRRK